MTAPAFNTIAWFQVGTDQPDDAKRFYGGLFDWAFDADPNGGGNYDMVRYAGADAPAGGIAHLEDASGNHAIFMVLVEDVAAAVARAEELGGKVTVAATTTPDGLVFAHLLDSSGNHFGVFTPPPSDGLMSEGA